MVRVLVLAAALAGCSYDFEDYLPVGDASFDSRTDGVVQDTSSCTPLNADVCYTTAKTCGDTCRNQRVSCEAMCGSQPCRNGCRNTESACRTSCVSDCSTCTQNRGCATPARCTSEVG